MRSAGEKMITIQFSKPDKQTVFRWIARGTGTALFLLWGGFFLEHLEWLGNPGKLPPASVYFSCFAHMVMQIGFIAAFFNGLAAGIAIIAGGFVLFSRAGAMFPLFFIITSAPGVFFLYEWVLAMRCRGGLASLSLPYAAAGTVRWLALIGGTFVAALIAAVWYGGEYIWFGFTFQDGWTVSMSEGFPNPLAMSAAERGSFVLSHMVAIGLLIQWKWPKTGASIVVAGSLIIAATQGALVSYPLLPAAPVMAIVIMIASEVEKRVHP